MLSNCATNSFNLKNISLSNKGLAFHVMLQLFKQFALKFKKQSHCLIRLLKSSLFCKNAPCI